MPTAEQNQRFGTDVDLIELAVPDHPPHCHARQISQIAETFDTHRANFWRGLLHQAAFGHCHWDSPSVGSMGYPNIPGYCAAKRG
jgi:hypothetical protein